MGFKENLLTRINEYTNLTVRTIHPETGVVSTRNFKVPYYNNEYGLGTGKGKATPGDIAAYIRSQNINWVNNTSSSYELKPAATIQTQMKTFEHISKTGVDCNGLVYYVANEASNGAVRTYFNQYLTESQTSYASGLHIKYYLCSKNHGVAKTKAKDVVPGCFIHLNNYGHIMIVYDVVKNTSGVVTQIKYAHSHMHDPTTVTTDTLSTSGPNKGYITVGNETQDLNGSSQTWVDVNNLGQPLKNLYATGGTILLICLANLT